LVEAAQADRRRNQAKRLVSLGADRAVKVGERDQSGGSAGSRLPGAGRTDAVEWRPDGSRPKLVNRASASDYVTEFA